MGACLQPQGSTTFQVTLPNTNVPVVKVVFAAADALNEVPAVPPVPESVTEVDAPDAMVQVHLLP